MLNLIVRRFLRMFVILFVLSILLFVLLNVSGDPALLLVPPEATQETIDRVRREHGLDRPLPIQYIGHLSRLLVGDFGTSLRYRQPAVDMVLRRFPNTLQLTITSLVIALVFGVPLGVLLSTRIGSTTDTIGLSLAVLTRAMPGFWLGIVAIFIFSVRLQWVPTSGTGTLAHLVLPATTLSAAFLAQIVVLIRAGVVDVLQEDFIRTARSKGLRERAVLYRHALRVTLIPLVTFVGLTFGNLLGGAIITEVVFAWPGIGSLAVEAIYSRDFPLVQAALILMAVSIVVANLAVDVAYGFLDPRIRWE